MEVYRAKSKITGEYFKSSRDRTVFMTTGALKSAWATGGRYSWSGVAHLSKKFDNQDEYEIIEYDLVPTKQEVDY